MTKKEQIIYLKSKKLSVCKRLSEVTNDRIFNSFQTQLAFINFELTLLTK